MLSLPCLAIAAVIAIAAAAPDENIFFQRAACRGDNCFNGLNKTGTARVARSTDCSSFLRTTVTPCPTATASFTVTTTSTYTLTVPYGGDGSKPARREANAIDARATTSCPSTQSQYPKPTYASGCSNLASYSSACSCLGVTSTITTLTPTTYTPTYTATATSTYYAPSKPFYIKATDGKGKEYGVDTNFESIQLQTESVLVYDPWRLEQGTNYAFNEYLRRNYYYGGYLQTLPDEDEHGYYGLFADRFSPRAVCHLADPVNAAGALSIVDSVGNTFVQICNGYSLYISPPNQPLSGCEPVNLTAVPA